jgi:hypothetical protein
MVVTNPTWIEHLLVVANTRHGPGGHRRVRVVGGPDHDHLRDPVDAWRFLDDHEVPVPADPPDPRTLGRLRSIRDLARGLIVADLDEARLEALLGSTRFRLEPDGALRPVAGGWAGVVAGLLPPLVELRAIRDDLRQCGNPLCRFLFLDRSRNRSRIWCEMAVCGNRARVGRFRHRHARHRASA